MDASAAPPRFVSIPAGWFVMGDAKGRDGEQPEHRVWVDAFLFAVYPVTRLEYRVFVDSAGHALPRDWDAPSLSGDDLPVVGVSWDDAMAYVEWLSPRVPGVRLPTEAEWERAARGGVDGRDYPWGDQLPLWLPNGGRGPLAGPWPVALGPPTAFGLHGIGANIHEWCADWYDEHSYSRPPERNPTGPAQGRRRASRGGSWRHDVTISRNAARSRLDPTFRYTDYGFRLARTPFPV
ncbi:MAG: SUMF1/EgtB/PvdO family nonheme iron enzyme [Vicinamibacterales bacterium]